MNEKKLHKFRLIDREGFIQFNPYNREVLQEHFPDDIVEGHISTTGCLRAGARTMITPQEFRFFEEIKEEPTETPAKPVMTAGTRKSLEELLERAIAYQQLLATRYHVPNGLSDLSLRILRDELNNNHTTIIHFQNALKEG